MSFSVQVNRDSVSREDMRLVTMVLYYPRFIHAELMTHRVFSRNASSSRAIPIKKLIAAIRRDPAMPIHWGKHQAGMQANKELTGFSRTAMRWLWLLGMWIMTTIALAANKLGAHKQIVNRLIEPWSHITVIVTSSEWENFFELRCHPDAQPEMRHLADLMRAAYDASEPKLLEYGQWHLPFVEPEELGQFGINIALKLSVARCARVSYLTHDGKRPKVDADIALYNRLVGARPLHASPAEHQATPDECGILWAHPEEHGNLNGFKQYRKQLEKTVFA